MKRETDNGKQARGQRLPGVGVSPATAAFNPLPSPLRLRVSALKPRTAPARAAFTLMELLVVMSIMLIVSTILVAGYFGMTRAASYTAAETDVFNHLQLARQRASLDGTRVFVAVGTGALVALVALTLRGPLSEWTPPESALAIAGAALIFMPSVIVDTAGGIRLPYSDWITQAKARVL